MIVIKHFHIKQILELNYPKEVDMMLNKRNHSILTKTFILSTIFQ